MVFVEREILDKCDFYIVEDYDSRKRMAIIGVDKKYNLIDVCNEMDKGIEAYEELMSKNSEYKKADMSSWIIHEYLANEKNDLKPIILDYDEHCEDKIVQYGMAFSLYAHCVHTIYL